jgi:hypothetical protein
MKIIRFIIMLLLIMNCSAFADNQPTESSSTESGSTESDSEDYEDYEDYDDYDEESPEFYEQFNQPEPEPESESFAEIFKKSFSGGISLYYNSNFFDTNSSKSENDMSASLGLNYKLLNFLDGAYTLKFTYSGYNDLSGAGEFHFGDIWIGVTNSKLIYSGDVVKAGIDARMMIPTSESSSKSDVHTKLKIRVPVSFSVGEQVEGLSLSYSPTLTKYFLKDKASIGSKNPQYSFSQSLSISYALLDDLRLFYTPSLTKYFHEYKTSFGSSNTEYSFSHSLAANYVLHDDWSVYFSGGLSRRWNYNKSSSRDRFSISADLSYTVNSRISLSSGYSNSGEIYNSINGTYDQVKLFDEKSSSFYISSSINF